VLGQSDLSDPHSLRSYNRRLAVALVILTAISPLPLGSNRPIYWTISAIFVSLVGFIYALCVWQSRRPLPYNWFRLRLVGLLFASTCIFLLVQALPLGAIIGMTQFSANIASRTLSLDADATCLMLIRMLGYGFFFFLMLQAAASRTRAQRILEVIFFVVTGYAAYSLLALTQLGDTLLGMQKWAYLGSATGTFVNRNSFATFLAFGLTVGVTLELGILIPVDDDPALHPWSRRGGRSLLVLTGLGFILAALLASQSRMGLFAGLVASVAVTTVAVVRAGSRRSLLTVTLLGTGVLCVATLSLLYGSSVLERLLSLEGSADVRVALYKQVFEMISKRPVLGYGGGSFELAFPLFHHTPVSADLVWDKAHSTYLSLWTELGVIAGSIPILILAALAGRCLRSAWHDPSIRVVSLSSFGVAVVGAVHSTVDFSLEIQANAYCFLAVLALGVATERLRGPSHQSEELRA
jgi:O-antigen ligase